MKILFFCPIWGQSENDIEKVTQEIKEAGYDGIEMTLPLFDNGLKNRIIDAIKNAGLLFIAQHWETVNPDFQKHKEEYLLRLNNLADATPMFINSHTGRDYFSFEQNMELIQMSKEISAIYKTTIIHETHRGSFNFAAHITKHFLDADKELRLCADFSHWCNVAESLLEDQTDAVKLAISRADHIHSRVGFAQGPQIPDPRAKEWSTELNAHTIWWDKIVARAKSENREYFTITSEFGPFPYMQILPYSKQPIANQWEINVFMLNFLRKRYQYFVSKNIKKEKYD